MMLVAGVAIVALASGCGNDEDSSSASNSGEGGSSALSKAAYVRQANAACLKERGKSFEDAVPPQEVRRVEDLGTKRAIRALILLIIEAENANLRRLGPSENGEEEFEAMMSSLENALDEAREEKNKSFDEVEDYFREANRKLRDYGLDKCVKSTG
jgi:hypothetical protein